MAATAPDQNTVPITAASWIMAFAYGSSVSRRAAIRPWTSIGTGISAPGSSVQVDPVRGEDPAVLEQPDELLARTGDCPPTGTRSPRTTTAGRTACSRRDPMSRAVSRLRQAGQVDAARIAGSCRPVRGAVEELWTGRRHEEHGARAGVVDDAIDEGEQGVVRPMQILEHEHDRVGSPPGTPGTAARR